MRIILETSVVLSWIGCDCVTIKYIPPFVFCRLQRSHWEILQILEYRILFWPGSCDGCACYNSSCTCKSFEQGIQAFLYGHIMFFSVFIVLSLWGNLAVPVQVIFYAYQIRVIMVFGLVLLTCHHLQKPRAWNLQALQVWFQSVIATKDFIYFIYCLTFVTSHLHLKC